MKNKRLTIRSACIGLTALLFTASAPAFASPVNNSSSSGHSSVTSGQVSVDLQTKTNAEVEAQDQTGDTSSQTGLHAKGSNLVAELRKTHKGTETAADLQKQCVAHKQGLTTKFNAIVTNSQRIQNRIDDVLAKAQTYQQTSNLNPPNFDSLLAAAQTAQTTSDASIAALKDVTPSIDCNSTSVASDVATFKAAAQQTRDNLKAYRTAVKAVLKALETAKSTATGSTQQ